MTLRDAIDKDQFIIEKVCYLDEELKVMSLDELETLKMQITKKISGLSLALKETAGNFSKEKLNRAESNDKAGRLRVMANNIELLLPVITEMHKQGKLDFLLKDRTDG
jgi:hypothetical protein